MAHAVPGSEQQCNGPKGKGMDPLQGQDPWGPAVSLQGPKVHTKPLVLPPRGPRAMPVGAGPAFEGAQRRGAAAEGDTPAHLMLLSKNDAPAHLMPLSKNLARILRHAAPEVGISLDFAGWCNVSELLQHKDLQGWSEKDVREVVRLSMKEGSARFELWGQQASAEGEEDVLWVRATNKHSCLEGGRNAMTRAVATAATPARSTADRLLATRRAQEAAVPTAPPQKAEAQPPSAENSTVPALQPSPPAELEAVAAADGGRTPEVPTAATDAAKAAGDGAEAPRLKKDCWERFLLNDSSGACWWWNSLDEDWFLEGEPQSWQRFMDPSSDKFYWWNEKTDECFFEPQCR